MGTINLFNSLDNSYQVINGCGKLSDLLPTINFEHSIILKSGNRLDKDYMVLPDDVLFVRKTPGVSVALGYALIGIGAAVIGGLFIGSLVGDIIDSKNKKMQEKAQRDAQNLASQINQYPFIKGAQNKSALGNTVPYIIGDVYNTPYKMTDGYYSIENGDGASDFGSKQYYNAVFNLGYGNQKITDILIGSDSILKDVNGISEGVHNADESSIFYDAANKIEVCQSGTNFTLPYFGKKVICTQDGAEIKHPKDGPAEPIIRTLSDYTKTVEICIQFNGLRKYDSDNSKWVKLKNKVVPYWTNVENPTDNDWIPFNFDNMNNNEIELNTNHTIRFIAKKTFTAAEAYGKTIKIRLEKITPAQASNANESCYLVYYQSFCYDNAKSSASNLIDCSTVENDLTSKTTRIGLRLIANDNTTDNLNEVHVLSCGLAKTWNGLRWSTEKNPTRNPASWIYEIMTSLVHIHSKYAEDELELDSFAALYEHCERNEIYIDAILTEGIKKEDLLAGILDVCSAVMFINAAGKWEIRIDQEETVPVALLNSETISDINYVKDLSRKPDGLKVTFTNRDSWQIDTFYVKADGTPRTQDDTFTEYNLKYVTTYKHAYKLAVKHLKMMKLQPREITVDVGRDGDYYPLFSTVMLQYTTFRQGLNSSVIAGLIEDETGIIGIKLSDQVEFVTGNFYGAIIQAQNNNGKKHFYKKITGTDKTKTIFFDSPISIDEEIIPSLGNIISIGLLDENREFSKITNVMKITKISSNGTAGYKLTLKDYNPEIYQLDGPVPEYKSNITLPPKPIKYVEEKVSKADILDAEIEAVKTAASSIVSAQPAYRGMYDITPDVSFFMPGDWIFNSTEEKLLKLTADGWQEINYTNETAYMFTAAQQDLLKYTQSKGNIGLYTAAFIANLSTMAIQFQNYVASVQNPTPAIEDQLISMGKNPVNQNDNYGFLLQKLKNTNPLVWQKYLWSDFKDDALNFGINGELQMNNDIVFNQSLTSKVISTTQPADVCTDGKYAYILEGTTLYRYDGTNYTAIKTSWNGNTPLFCAFVNNILFVIVQNGYRGYFMQTTDFENWEYAENDGNRVIFYIYNEIAFASNEYGACICSFPNGSNAMQIGLIDSAGICHRMNEKPVPWYNHKGIRNIEILPDSVLIRCSMNSLLSYTDVIIDTETEEYTLDEVGANNEYSISYCNGIYFKQMYYNPETTPDLKHFKYSYDNVHWHDFTINNEDIGFMTAVAFIKNMYFIFDFAHQVYCSNNLHDWKTVDVSFNVNGAITEIRKAVYINDLDDSIVLTPRGTVSLTPVRFNFPSIGHSADGNSHYIKLTNGLIVQWGIVRGAPHNTNYTVMLPVSYSNTDYYVGLTCLRIEAQGYINAGLALRKELEPDRFVAGTYYNNFLWFTIGY